MAAKDLAAEVLAAAATAAVTEAEAGWAAREGWCTVHLSNHPCKCTHRKRR